ncbi:1-acyl-sn-glycerol-3-phosphate acyltransferase [Oxalobacteraceae bacterium IMCC9480]|jgi:1-acyl-sn-glycerol-3-phosphate acyltransferase|nr:1-acyl-sn-glycerol-3-phosphate acyltransferase [Oxalobacteraceae bacterium IMCC9480]
MPDRPGKFWRVLATGFCFATFGIGGLLLRVLVFPLLDLFVRRPRQRVRLARAVIRLAFRGFIGLMQGVGVLRYEVIGVERLARDGLLILANHPTLIDTVFLMALLRRADGIVKAGLWNNPFTRGPVRSAGYVKNDQGPALLANCLASLQEGNNLIVFPEGTRTGDDGVIRLKRGAAHIAVYGQCNITPVLIRCVPMTLAKGTPWWRVPDRPVHFRIEVQDDILVAPFLADGAGEPMAARHLTTYLQTYFTEKSQHDA